MILPYAEKLQGRRAVEMSTIPIIFCLSVSIWEDNGQIKNIPGVFYTVRVVFILWKQKSLFIQCQQKRDYGNVHEGLPPNLLLMLSELKRIN